MIAALLVTECQLEAKSTGRELILVTLDTKKAFDVVNHDILLRNLFMDDAPPGEWMLIKDMYMNMKSNVQWMGEKSSDFSINQGVRQGGVLSTEHYKRFNNPLLLKLEKDFEGAKIGTISIPHTTCADDLALLSHSNWEVKLMLKTVEQFSKDHRYDINAAKSSCIVHNKKAKGANRDLHLNEESIPESTATTHLGVHRNTKAKLDVEAKINIGRRTAYSLLGAGFHGRNGLKQDVKAHIWSLYVVPRMLFGIETTPYTKSDLRKLDSFQTKTLKQVQHLPDRVANVAANALLGAIPLSTHVHKNTLNLFYTAIQSNESVAYCVLERQLAVKSLSDTSFTSRVRQLLLLYGLPDAYTLMEAVPDRATWKKMLTEAVNLYTEDQWQSEITGKPSLKYLNPQAVKAGKAHHIYSTVRPNLEDTGRAEIKSRLLTGSYTLQANRSTFNQYQVDPTCRLCTKEAETREHFIARCATTDDIRYTYKKKFAAAVSHLTGPHLLETIDSPEQFTQLVLDCSHPSLRYCKSMAEEEIEQIELLSRQFLAKLHYIRCKKLAQLDP